MNPPYERGGSIEYQLGAVRERLDAIQETMKERAIVAAGTEGKLGQLQMTFNQTLSEIALLRDEVRELKAPVHDLVSLKSRITAILMAGGALGSTITAFWYYWGISLFKWLKQ